MCACGSPVLVVASALPVAKINNKKIVICCLSCFASMPLHNIGLVIIIKYISKDLFAK